MNRTSLSYQLCQETLSCEELVILAVAFLSSEETRLSRFLSLTGLDPADIPQLLGQNEFQLAILDHLAADEALLLCCAETLNITPESISLARGVLESRIRPRQN